MTAQLTQQQQQQRGCSGASSPVWHEQGTSMPTIRVEVNVKCSRCGNGSDHTNVQALSLQKGALRNVVRVEMPEETESSSQAGEASEVSRGGEGQEH